jgi:hypothetical protein
VEGPELLKALKARAPSRAPWGKKLLKMDDDIGICDQCKRPLMRIDRYGEEFVGCVACNRWGSSGTDLFMELSEDDLRALTEMILTT